MSKKESLPNIIFVLADDMGYGDASCYGATKIHTPNLDELANKGIMFTDAHSSSAVCTPSRYSVLTGRYCFRSPLKNGVLMGHGRPLIEKNRMTVASILKNAGYNTGAFGKWHLGLGWHIVDEDLQESDPKRYDYSKGFTGGPTALGFDKFFGISGSLDMAPYCYLEDDHTIGIPKVEKPYYHPQQRKGYWCEDFKDDEVDQKFVEKALGFIESSVQEDKPFFTYIPLASPHRPCVPPKFMKGKSQAGLRGDMVCMVDWCVGQITKRLKELDVFDNTLIVFSSDNGARPCDVDGELHGHKSCGDFKGYKADIWDGGHREPFIISWPNKIKEGRQSDSLVSLMDFTATCADIVGYNLKDQEGEDSFSLMPIIEDTKDEIRKTLVHHSLKGMFAIRNKTWKYVEGLGSGGFDTLPTLPVTLKERGQLYNMSEDPQEIHNLYLYKKSIVQELQEQLDDIKEQGSRHVVS